MQVSQKCLQPLLCETNSMLRSSARVLSRRDLTMHPMMKLQQQQQFSTRALSQRNFAAFSSQTYFLKGLDSRELTHSQMEDMSAFVNNDVKGQSFLVYNSHEALRKLQMWREKLSWIQPYYALKSNPIDPLVRDLTQNGANLDVASQGEIKKGFELGVDASRMIYSNPVKEEKDIEYAAKNNVLFTTADSIDELLKIKAIAPNMKILWRISITEDNSKQLSTVFSNKFGDDISSLEEAHLKFSYIAKELGVKLHGIHFHCGSGKNGSTSFLKAVSIARKCLEIGRIYGHPMETLDLGGGYPSADLNDHFVSALEDTRNDPLGYNVIAEPGRHFSSHSCYLFTRVLAKRFKQNKTCFHVNDSLYHSFNCVLMDGVSFENDFDQVYGEINNQTNQIAEKQTKVIPTSLFGMTCDGLDVISKNVGLPENLKVGDWLCLSGMGSYTFGPKSGFNGMHSTTRIFEWDSPIGVASSQKAKETSTEQQQSPAGAQWNPTLKPAY